MLLELIMKSLTRHRGKRNMFDAHVHMGYYQRKGFNEQFYYSPRKVFGVLSRAGCQEFIVSSTCSQHNEIDLRALIREAAEMKRIAGGRAHIFFWLNSRDYQADHNLTVLGSGIFEGVKMHELVDSWMQKHSSDLRRILGVLQERRMPVQFHTGMMQWCRPKDFMPYAKEFPSLKFDLAHFYPSRETIDVMMRCPNVYTDTALYIDELYAKLPPIPEDVRRRVLFGTDFPAYHDVEEGFSACYKEKMEMYERNFGRENDMKAFVSFLARGED